MINKLIQEMDVEFRNNLLNLINELSIDVSNIEDICVVGSFVGGWYRLETIFNNKKYLQSDLDIIVWTTEEINKKPIILFYHNLNDRICIKFKPVSKKHDLYNTFLIPQYSLINNVLFDFNQEEINNYITFLKSTDPNFSIGRIVD